MGLYLNIVQIILSVALIAVILLQVRGSGMGRPGEGLSAPCST